MAKGSRTRGPWMAKGRYIIAPAEPGKATLLVASTAFQNTSGTPSGEDLRSIRHQEADAEHIVACVNACERFNPKAVAALTETAAALRNEAQIALATIAPGVTFTMDDDLRDMAGAATQIEALAELLRREGLGT